MKSPVKLGRMVSHDKLGISLHDAAKQGNKRSIKRAIDQGICVDYPNDEGQTPLFCACFANQEGVAKILLQRGANPNEKSNNGQTPVLMACFHGNISLLCRMIEAGGDLRYHDNDGRNCQDWALMNENPQKRIKMLEFVNKSQVNAMTYGKKEVRFQEQSNSVGRSRTLLRIPESLMDMIRTKVGASPLNSKINLKKVESRGFGRVYTGDKDNGLVSVIPLVQEAALQFDNYGVSFENGAFMTMESMFWNKTAVTAKKLHKATQPGGYIDLLIAEAEQMGKLHHPNILLLMGVCQANTLDSMVLVFERVNVGSLYYYLHVKLERLPTQNIRDIVIQICDAMIFLHHHDIIHCNLSSHAIYLVNPYSAKIGNFEYAMDSDKANLGKHSEASQMKYQNALYNWMAPELMEDHEPGFYSDVYSYCCLLWEIFVCEVPWDMCEASFIKHKLMVDGESLLKESHKIPNLFKTIIEYGLQLDFHYRLLDFDTIRTWLTAPPDTIPTLPTGYQVNKEESTPKVIDDVDSYQPQTSHRTGHHQDQLHQQQHHTQQSKHQKPVHHKPSHNTSHQPSHQPSHHPQHQPSHHTQHQPSHHTQHQPSHHTQHQPSHHSSAAPSAPPRHHRSSSYSHNENNHHDSHRRSDKEWSDEDDVDNAYSNKEQGYFDNSRSERHPKSPGKRSLPGQHSKKMDNIQFDVDRTDNGQVMGYHVKVTSPYSRRKNQAKQHGYHKDSTTTESSAYDYDDRSKGNFIPTDNKKRIDFNSPTKFSYLALNQQSSSSGRGVCKPASHNTESHVEDSTKIQLSTAGSLYALYNHDTNRDEDYISPPSKPNRVFEAIPRRIQNNGPSSSERTTRDINDPSWFGGQGSVRNLVSLYQQHESEHDFQQAVLEGQLSNKDSRQAVNNSASSLPPHYPRPSQIKTPDNSTSKLQPKQKPQLLKNTTDVCTSPMYNPFKSNDMGHGKPLTNDKKSACNQRDYSATMDNVGQYFSTDDSQSSLTTLSTGCSLTETTNSHPDPQSASSVASDLIATWIDDELLKVQTDLQQETTMCSPTRDEDEPCDLLEEIMDEVCKPNMETKAAKTSGEIRARKMLMDDDDDDDDGDDEVDNGRLYDRKTTFDKEMKSHTPRNSHNYSDEENFVYHDLFSDENYLDLPPIQAKKKSKHKAKHSTYQHTDTYTNKVNQSGYLTTVRVETSLAHPGHHFLTHTSQDLGTGKIKTLHTEEIRGNSIQSSVTLD